MKINNNYIFLKSILSGILIGLSGFLYLTLLPINSIIASISFAFGLISIVSLGYPLYTGKAGDINITMMAYGIRALYRDDINQLFKKVLLGNIIGCFLCTILINFSTESDTINLSAASIINSRLNFSFWTIFFKSIGCGLIMDLVVHSYKEKQSLIPILFGVPAFILLGFIHSIADTFYIMVSFSYIRITFGLIWYYIVIILGNFIGCRIRKSLTFNFEENDDNWRRKGSGTINSF